MSPATWARPCIAVAACCLALSAAAVAVERGLVRAATARAESVRALRIELQRATLARVRLERDGDALDVLGTGLDDTRIAILEAVDALARSSRVVVLGHALREAADDPYAEPESGSSEEVRVLRLTLELEAPHAVRLVEALDALGDALPGRPMDVTGCRVDRTGTGRGADGGDVDAGVGAGSLVASCALDWYWWPS